MESFAIYLLKASSILALFYLTHQVFLKKETFFKINRHFLIIGILLAFALPLITITNYIEVVTVSPEQILSSVSSNEIKEPSNPINWTVVLFIVYLFGVLALSGKFIIQLLSLLKLANTNPTVKQGKFTHVEVNTNIAPFSFFNHIFYNPKLYAPNELTAIINHEKAHSSEWHSIDVVLSHITTILTWLNPFSWLYKTNIKQNLEFLADQGATREEISLKNYQYTLLKVSGNQFCTSIVNHFYNSLIKKRIVMLNKSKSNKKNVLKTALIIPVLGIFLVSFNTKDVFIPMNSFDTMGENAPNTKTIELIIDKNTTDKELKDMKKDLSDRGVDFSYTVVHNNKKEIIKISVHFSTEKENGRRTESSSTFNNGDDPIDPIHIIYDEESNSISMGNQNILHIDKDIHVNVDEDSDHTIWISSDSDTGPVEKTIEIIEKDGTETIKVNGKEVTGEELDKIKKEEVIHSKHIKIEKSDDGKESSVIIIKDSDDDDIEVISKKSSNFFFIDQDGKDKPLFIIDGIESKKKDLEKLNPSEIESINVLKGEKAKEKYGKKAKNGVVQITTKKHKP